MNVLLEIILPFFALMACGYFCQARGILGERGTDILNGFVYWFALPALLFRVMASVEPSVLLNGNVLAAYAGASVFVMLLAIVLGRAVFKNTVAEGYLSGMNASYGNTGFLGIPLTFVAFGEAAAVPTIITVILSVLVSVFCLAGMTAAQQEKSSLNNLLFQSLGLIFKNPLLIAPLAGLILAVLHIPLPATVSNFTQLLGNAATPCALFAVGMFLYARPVSGALVEVAFSNFLKLLIMPLIVWGLVQTIFPVPPLWEAVIVIMAATPTGAGSFILAKQFGLYEVRTSSAILLSTLASLPVLFVLLHYYLPQVN